MVQTHRKSRAISADHDLTRIMASASRPSLDPLVALEIRLRVSDSDRCDSPGKTGLSGLSQRNIDKKTTFFGAFCCEKSRFAL